MRKELDVVRLRHAVDELPVGSTGVILLLSPSSKKEYLVEFPGIDVYSPIVTSVHEDDLENQSAEVDT